MPFKIQVTPSPHATAIGVNKRKHFAKKLMNEDFKLACIFKFLKFLLELDKFIHKLSMNNKSIQSMKTMEILHDKSNMRMTTLRAKSTTS